MRYANVDRVSWQMKERAYLLLEAIRALCHLCMYELSHQVVPMVACWYGLCNYVELGGLPGFCYLCYLLSFYQHPPAS